MFRKEEFNFHGNFVVVYALTKMKKIFFHQFSRFIQNSFQYSTKTNFIQVNRFNNFFAIPPANFKNMVSRKRALKFSKKKKSIDRQLTVMKC